MRRRSGLIVLLCSLMLWAPTQAEAGGRPVTASSHIAVELSVTLLHHSYPRDAIAAVTVMIHNHSTQTFSLPNGCGLENPSADVLTGSKKLVYPPALVPASVQPPECFPPIPGKLKPGQTLRSIVYVILRAPWVRATAELFDSRNHEYHRTGKPVYVALSSGRPPTDRVSTRGGLHADLTPPPGAGHAPLVYRDWTRCSNGKGDTSLDWQLSPGTRIYPTRTYQCDRITEWHAVAGWAGYRIAKIDYVRSG